MMKKKKLIREQVDASLSQFSSLYNTNIPRKGWIRAIRDALGMSARQLAERLGIAQQAVARIEKDEIDGSVTIKTMRRIAEQLDCQFVYGFVSKTSLKETIQTRAKQVATKRLTEANQTMALENQSLYDKENTQVLVEMIDELVYTSPSNLWDIL
jgi:predicted DNA-binding mobile mystery protein A